MAILISIRPEHNANILNGLKTIEVRTSCPKEWKDYLARKTKNKPEPEKCYIYCTKSKPYLYRIDDDDMFELLNKIKYLEDWEYGYVKDYNAQNGKIIAEFMLDQVDMIKICDPDILINGEQCNQDRLEKETCLKIDELMEYIGYGDDYDGWGKDWAVGYLWHISNLKIYDRPKELSELGIKRPFQSWGYINGKDN